MFLRFCAVARGVVIRSWRAVVRRVRVQGVVLKEVASTVSTRMINSIKIQSLVLSSFRNQKQIKSETRTHAFNAACLIHSTGGEGAGGRAGKVRYGKGR